MQLIVPAVVVSYLIGSIPTAYLFGRLLKGIDIRKFGSGNVGATNALRTLGRGAGITVLVIDMLKGFITVVFLGDAVVSGAPFLGQETIRVVLGLSCIIGHTWTVFLKFKGGKGVATTFGVVLGLAVRIPGLNIIAGLVILTWLVIFIFTMIVSLASITSVMAMPVYIFIFKQPKILLYFSILLAIFIILRHRSNIKRLLKGEEPRLSFRKPH